MHVPLATLLFGSLNLLLLGLLGFNVSRVRLAKKVFITTDAPSPEFHRVIRAHGNAAEWIPGMVLMLFILDMSGADTRLVMLFGAALLLARLMHAAGVLMSNKISTAGATLCFILAVVMPIAGLVRYAEVARVS